MPGAIKGHGFCHSREGGNPENYDEVLLCLYFSQQASKRNGTLYIGVTNSLIRRVYEHKINLIINGFTKKYNVHNLVYYERFDDVKSAIQYETRLKKWNRKWKLRLIEKDNPEWKDLYKDLII